MNSEGAGGDRVVGGVGGGRGGVARWWAGPFRRDDREQSSGWSMVVTCLKRDSVRECFYFIFCYVYG